jgi:hypothetical protein
LPLTAPGMTLQRDSYSVPESLPWSQTLDLLSRERIHDLLVIAVRDGTKSDSVADAMGEVYLELDYGCLQFDSVNSHGGLRIRHLDAVDCRRIGTSLDSTRSRFAWAACSWHHEYCEHRPDQSGNCQQCLGRSPCFPHQLAVRALIEACTPGQLPPPLSGPPRIVAASTCRWCRQTIERHSLYGWVHTTEAFILCRQTASLPLCQAEPISTTSGPKGPNAEL